MLLIGAEALYFENRTCHENQDPMNGLWPLYESTLKNSQEIIDLLEKCVFLGDGFALTLQTIKNF